MKLTEMDREQALKNAIRYRKEVVGGSETTATDFNTASIAESNLVIISLLQELIKLEGG